MDQNLFCEVVNVNEKYLLPLFKFVQMLNSIVGDPYTLDFARIHGFDEGLPGSKSAVRATIRRVNQVEVNVLQPTQRNNGGLAMI